MNNVPNQQNWYSRATKPAEAGMAERKEAIARYRSPHTIADEIYRILTWGIQPLLLVFCMALSFSSYQAFFAHNFSPLFATAGAVILALVIELGKIRIGGYLFQVPFLSGIQVLKSSFPAFCVWAGAGLLTVVTFVMSVHNSTTGAAMLAQKVGFEKNELAFMPNTADIDAQLDQANSRIQAAKDVKWKGTVTYQAQKAMQADSKTISRLQAQREKAIEIQRADFERRRTQSDHNTNNGAAILMAAGGWVEALQAICLFLVAACMATIDRVMTNERRAPVSPTLQNIQGPSDPLLEYTKNSPLNGRENRAQIGFQWESYGKTPPTPVESVTHPPVSVTHQSKTQTGDDILKLARREFGSWAANVGNGKHDPENCMEHIYRILDNLQNAIGSPGFAASTNMLETSHEYFRLKLNELQAKGYPYHQKEHLLELLDFLAVTNPA